MALPRGSLSERVRVGGICDGPEETEADVWFDDWDRGGVLLEEARHLKQWDKTVALLWFEDEEIPPPKRERNKEQEDLGLSELDGRVRSAVGESGASAYCLVINLLPPCKDFFGGLGCPVPW
jgi:hypothetical protein